MTDKKTFVERQKRNASKKLVFCSPFQREWKNCLIVLDFLKIQNEKIMYLLACVTFLFTFAHCKLFNQTSLIIFFCALMNELIRHYGNSGKVSFTLTLYDSEWFPSVRLLIILLIFPFTGSRRNFLELLTPNVTSYWVDINYAISLSVVWN